VIVTAYALRDTLTMLGRNLRHLQRCPGLSLFPIGLPPAVQRDLTARDAPRRPAIERYLARPGTFG